ncbi:MAG: YtxH domain-containing protein [Patescibacteria group bacterium]|nr:YtxH domain-containing protein [Patescibacteria group bacterium]
MSHRHHKGNTAKAVAIGGAVAAVAGFVAGVLSAPKSGQQTRTDLKKAADRKANQAEKELNRVHAELTKAIDDSKGSTEKLTIKAKKEFDELVLKAKDTKEKGREMLSAVQEGKTTNKDVKKAIEDANNAIEHLREYIKKR